MLDESSDFCHYDPTLWKLNLVRLFQQPDIWNGKSTALKTKYGLLYVPDELSLEILLLQELRLPLELVGMILLTMVRSKFKTDLDSKGFQYAQVQSFAEFSFLSSALRKAAESKSELKVPGFGSAISLFPLVCGLDVILEERPDRQFSNVCILAMMQRLSSNPVSRNCSEPKFQAIILEEPILPNNWCTESIKHLGKDLGIGFVYPGASTFCDSDCILVGSPIIVLDYLRESKIDTCNIQMCVLDGLRNWHGGQNDFDPSLRELASLLNANPIAPQWVIMNTDYASHLSNLVNCFPLRIRGSTPDCTLCGVHQFYIACGKQEWKPEVLVDLFDSFSFTQVVVWCNTRRRIDYLYEKLTAMEFSCAAFHCDLTQVERKDALARMKEGSARILLVTDTYVLLSRDSNSFYNIAVSIHFDLPVFLDNYLHRCGRSGAYGRKGVAILFAAEENTDDMTKVKQLENFYSVTIPELTEDAMMNYL